MGKPHKNDTLPPQKLIRLRSPEPFVCFAFYALIFLIPWETLNLGVEYRNITLTQLVGIIFLGLALLQPRVCFKPPNSAIIWFSVYLFIYVILGIFQEKRFEGPIFSYFFTFLQLLIFFWISQNMLAYEFISKRAFLTFGISCLGLAVTVLSGMMKTEIAQDRITAEDLNANVYSALLSLGLLALVGLATNHKIVNYKIRALAWLSFSFLAVAIVQSGSRGSMAVLLVGFLVLMFKGKGLKVNPKALLLVFLAVGAVIVMAFQSEAVRVRWERTLLEGETAGREVIYSNAVKMFFEKPLVGWGPVTHYYELGSRQGRPYYDPHNVYFWVLLESGLIGAAPFFRGIWLCGKEAWIARMGVHGQLPLAMTLYILLISLNGSHHQTKPFWLVLAYAVASGSLARNRKLSKQTSKSHVVASA